MSFSQHKGVNNCRVLAFLVLFLASECFAGASESYSRNENFLNRDLLHEIGGLVLKNPEQYGPQCIADIVTWVGSLPDIWAMQMLDAGGRIPSGILRGNLNSLGNFNECLDVHYRVSPNREINGKYCLARYPLPLQILNTTDGQKEDTNTTDDQIRLVNINGRGTLAFNIAVCIPRTCSGLEVQKALQDLASDTPLGGIVSNVTIPDVFCTDSHEVPMTAGDWGAIAVLIFFAIIIILSTAYDLHNRFWYKDPKSSNPLLVAFSIWSNSGRMFSVSPGQGSLRCLHGLRALSMMWIILAHRFTIVILSPIQNLTDVVTWMKSYAAMPIMAASVSVDTFFVLSGLLLSYVFFRQMKKEPYFNIPMFYFHRFIRLTPALAIMVLLQATLFKHLGSGPVWHVLNDGLVESCKKYWWSTLLYVHNYVNTGEMCINQSWYLAVDMQFFILSPIVLYPMLKKARVGFILACMWTLAALITVLVVCIINEFPAGEIPLNGGLSRLTDRNAHYYYAAYTRATPWLMGLLAGYGLQLSAGRKLHINKILVCLGWIVSITIMAAVIFGMHPLQQPTHVFSHAEDTMYLVFSRIAWATSLLWIIVSCTNGYGGPVNWFLSLRIWEILGHLSYTMYLVHLPLQFILMHAMKFVAEFSPMTVVHQFFGDFILTLLLAYCLSLGFESPILILEKVLLRKNPPKTVSRENLTTDAEKGEIQTPQEENKIYEKDN